MATYNSFDPRKLIRSTIGVDWYDEEEGALSVVTVLNAYNETVRIPIRMAEETRTESLDELPYIEMALLYTTYDPQDIGATTRKRQSYIDCHLYFTDTDDIDSTSFGKDVMDKMQDLIRDNHCVFGNDTNRMFVNISEVRYIREPKAHQVVFHYVFTIYAIHYDYC